MKLGRVVIIWQIKDLKLDNKGKYKNTEVKKNLRQIAGAKRQLFDLKTPIRLQNARRREETFDSSRIKQVYLILLWAFFFLAKDDLQDRMVFPGSKCMDGYISLEEKELLKSKFNVISQLIENVLTLEDSKAIVAWKEIIDDPFPSEVTLWIQEAMMQAFKS